MSDSHDLETEEFEDDQLLPALSDLSDLADDMGWSPDQEPDIEEAD